MISLTLYTSQAIHVNPQDVSTVIEAPTSSQWHGIRAFVKMHDGTRYEVQQDHAWILKQVNNVKGDYE